MEYGCSGEGIDKHVTIVPRLQPTTRDTLEIQTLEKISNFMNTIDREIFAVKKFSSMTCEIFCVTYVDLYLFRSLKSGDENLKKIYK